MATRKLNKESPSETAIVVARNSLPKLIADCGPKTAKAFLSFFTDNIRNVNTRQAYSRAASQFLHWCDDRRLQLSDVESFHGSAYIEHLADGCSIPTVKQHLAALRMLFDWMVVRQAIPGNPFHAVRGPRLKVVTGKTTALDEAEAKLLLLSISPDNVVGLRDRALIALMIYTFARISAALSMNIEDYRPHGRRMWVHLLEKGGRVHAMPAHHKLEEYLDAYIQAAGIQDEKKGPLFRSAKGRSGQLTTERLRRTNAWDAVRRRARKAGIRTQISNHSFRATGVTNYLSNGGKLETAQQMAGHADARTTKLYDRRNEQVSLDEIEKISI